MNLKQMREELLDEIHYNHPELTNEFHKLQRKIKKQDKEFIKELQEFDKKIKQRIKKLRDCKIKECIHCKYDYKRIIELYKLKDELAGYKFAKKGVKE